MVFFTTIENLNLRISGPIEGAGEIKQYAGYPDFHAPRGTSPEHDMQSPSLRPTLAAG
jgi:hypothetical protein